MGLGDRIGAIAGNVTKAALHFPDIAVKNTTTESSDLEQAFLNGLEGMSNALAAVDPTGTVADVSNSMMNLLGGTKTLEVQFNPSSLVIDAHGGGRVPINNYSSNDNNSPGTICFGPLAVYINISFTLIFDSTFIADAFAGDKFQLNATSLAKNAISAVAMGVTGKEYTVRPFVEGFLAAMRDPDHRTVIFQWGKLRYVGMMNSVNCSYTMFNPNGEPIRAEVQVNMISEAHPKVKVSENDQREILQNDNDYLGYWTKRYNAIVKGKTSMSGQTLKNVGTSLINL